MQEIGSVLKWLLLIMVVILVLAMIGFDNLFNFEGITPNQSRILPNSVQPERQRSALMSQDSQEFSDLMDRYMEDMISADGDVYGYNHQGFQLNIIFSDRSSCMNTSNYWKRQKIIDYGNRFKEIKKGSTGSSQSITTGFCNGRQVTEIRYDENGDIIHLSPSGR